MAENQGALSWDSQIEQESSFVLLPEGDYDFVVEKMERGMYQPSPQAKIREACPEAELTLKIQSSEGEATIKERLILHTATEWKISEFFIAIGQKTKGQPFTPNWGQVPGSTGRAKIKVDKYNDKNNNPREINRIDQFLEPQSQPQQQQGQSNPSYDF